jgi:ABC-type transport system involved in multi-copper enzyme maturation permease subunit
VQAEIPRSPAPRSRPAADEDYDDDYSSARPRRRGQVFSGLVLLLALAVSALTYYLTYETLAAIRITSGGGAVGGQVVSLGGVLLGALVVFLLALIALVVARPKALAGLALAASLLLPVAALVMGLWYGGSVLKQNVESEIAQAGPQVAAQGAAAVSDAIVKELESRGIDAGPVRDLVRSIVGS